jgi:hypothetical protein
VPSQINSQDKRTVAHDHQGHNHILFLILIPLLQPIDRPSSPALSRECLRGGTEEKGKRVFQDHLALLRISNTAHKKTEG